MAVDGVNTVNNTPPATPPVSNSTSNATTDTKSATLNYDSFLKLLVAQMKNQDPTDPIDASQQMSQLASFSTVEQAIKTNKHLESLIQETSMSQAASLIGKYLTSADGEMKGMVKSVEINSDGLTAILQNGDEVLIQSGITVSSAAPVDTGTDTDTGSDDPAPDDGSTDNASGT